MSGTAAGRASPDETEPEPGDIVTVYLLAEDDDEAEPLPIGRVAIAGDAMLSLVEADPRHAALLNDALARVNAKPEIALRSTAPVAGEDSVGAFAIARGEPAFAGAVRDFLERYYALRLG